MQYSIPESPRLRLRQEEADGTDDSKEAHPSELYVSVRSVRLCPLASYYSGGCACCSSGDPP